MQIKKYISEVKLFFTYIKSNFKSYREVSNDLRKMRDKIEKTKRRKIKYSTTGSFKK